MKRKPEIRCVAKTQRKSDIFVRQVSAAKIFERQLSSQFVKQSAKRNALLLKLAPQ